MSLARAAIAAVVTAQREKQRSLSIDYASGTRRQMHTSIIIDTSPLVIVWVPTILERKAHIGRALLLFAWFFWKGEFKYRILSELTASHKFELHANFPKSISGSSSCSASNSMYIPTNVCLIASSNSLFAVESTIAAAIYVVVTAAFKVCNYNWMSQMFSWACCFRHFPLCTSRSNLFGGLLTTAAEGLLDDSLSILPWSPY